MRGQAFHCADDDVVDRLIESDAWVAEQKLDGTRCMIHVTEHGVDFRAGDGGPLKHSAAAVHFDAIRPSFARLARPNVDAVFDCELVHSEKRLWVFDVPTAGAAVRTSTPFEDRRDYLEALFSRPWYDPEVVGLVPQARTAAEKRSLHDRVEAAGAEGVMLKRRDAVYAPGQRVRSALKVKFVKTADVVVTERDVNGRKNARLAVHHDGQLRHVGGCTMIGKYDAQPGEVIEVAYLYATNDWVLYQPRLVRPRPDKRPEDCGLDQLVMVNREMVEL